MGGAGRWRAAGGGWLRGGRGSSSVLRAPARRPARPWWPRAPPAALPPLSRNHPPPPAAAGMRGALRLMGEGGGKLSAVCSVPRARRHQGAPRPRLLRPPTCPAWALSPRTPDAATGQKPKTPPPPRPPPPVRQPRRGARRTRRSSCCLTQRDASGLNVTSRRRLPGAGGRGSVAEAQVQKGAGQLGTGLPLPLSPSVAVAASAAVRTDEGSEKQSFSTPASSRGANSFFRRHSPVRWFHLWSAPLPA